MDTKIISEEMLRAGLLCSLCKEKLQIMMKYRCTDPKQKKCIPNSLVTTKVCINKNCSMYVDIKLLDNWIKK